MYHLTVNQATYNISTNLNMFSQCHATVVNSVCALLSRSQVSPACAPWTVTLCGQWYTQRLYVTLVSPRCLHFQCRCRYHWTSWRVSDPCVLSGGACNRCRLHVSSFARRCRIPSCGLVSLATLALQWGNSERPISTPTLGVYRSIFARAKAYSLYCMWPVRIVCRQNGSCWRCRTWGPSPGRDREGAAWFRYRDNVWVREALCSRSYVRVSETPDSAVHTSDTESWELVRAPQIVLLKSLTAHRDKWTPRREESCAGRRAESRAFLLSESRGSSALCRSEWYSDKTRRDLHWPNGTGGRKKAF